MTAETPKRSKDLNELLNKMITVLEENDEILDTYINSQQDKLYTLCNILKHLHHLGSKDSPSNNRIERIVSKHWKTIPQTRANQLLKHIISKEMGIEEIVQRVIPTVLMEEKFILDMEYMISDQPTSVKVQRLARDLMTIYIVKSEPNITPAAEFVSDCWGEITVDIESKEAKDAELARDKIIKGIMESKDLLKCREIDAKVLCDYIRQTMP